MSTHQWGRKFIVTSADVDFITNHLLETETPMTTKEIALFLIEKSLNKEKIEVEERFRQVQLYTPSSTYQIGEQVMFSKLAFAVGTVTAIRNSEGTTEENAFQVIEVTFEDSTKREFASHYTHPHPLNAQQAQPETRQENLTPQEIFEQHGIEITGRLIEALRSHKELKQVAGYWFAKDLVLPVDIGILHLAEAVLDISGGGPLSTEEIITQIGGIGNAPLTLQIFSLNLAMSQDKRFDEVGPSGKILWYLKRLEPDAVQTIPGILAYKTIEYDEDLLTEDMLDLETELDDEHTPIDFVGKPSRATSTLLYPHRRIGTLPLNAKLRQIFPNARTPRIVVSLIDEIDGQRYTGWVVHEHRYVYGLFDYYTKHRLPVGAYVTVRRGETETEIYISYNAHKPRTEYIPIFTPSNDQILFDNKRRAIGAEYDPLLILGVDDLQAIDALAKFYTHKSLVTILKACLTELSKLYPQGSVHFTTLYSVVNVIRRCPPGPLFALLQANPEFQDMGNHYWRF